MSICRVRLRKTSNALTFRMSGEQIRLQVQPKLFGVNSWIAQMIRQWIPDCWSGDRKRTSPESAAANARYWQLMTSGRSQTLETLQELRRLAHISRRGTMELGGEDNDGLSQHCIRSFSLLHCSLCSVTCFSITIVI